MAENKKPILLIVVIYFFLVGGVLLLGRIFFWQQFISYAENNGVCDQTSYGDFVRLLYEHSSRKIYS